jgi:hypothetical protein
MIEKALYRFQVLFKYHTSHGTKVQSIWTQDKNNKTNNLINADDDNLTYFTSLLVTSLQQYYTLEATMRFKGLLQLQCEYLRASHRQFSHSRQKSRTYTATRLSQIISTYKIVQQTYTKLHAFTAANLVPIVWWRHHVVVGWFANISENLAVSILKVVITT